MKVVAAGTLQTDLMIRMLKVEAQLNEISDFSSDDDDSVSSGDDEEYVDTTPDRGHKITI